MSNLVDLPLEWERTTLGDVVAIEMGQSPDGSATNTIGNGLPLIGGASDLGATLPRPSRYTSSPTKVSALGDLILCVRATIGKLNYADDHYCLGRGVAGLNPIGFERDWLKYYLTHCAQDLDQAGTGSTFRQIDKATLQNWPLPLPPLNEQRRIVAKIEALMARSQQVKEALEAIPPLLDQFRQSVLAAAFRGDLTADWREKNPDVEPASELLSRTSNQLNQNFDEETKSISRDSDRQFIPNSWVWAPLKLIVKNIQAGKNFSCPEIPVTEDTVGLVKISSVTWGRFDDRETKTVIDQSKIDPSLFIQKGDFLISRANTIELVGASVVVEQINYKIMLSDKVWRVSFLEVENKFINFYLKSKCGRKEIENRATGNQLSMRNISQSAFKDIVIALPPLKEQQEIVRRFQTFFQAADQIKQQYQEAKAYLDQLDQSILAKAFRGELVLQDPNDEPASVLLERIRAERARREAKAVKKPKGKTVGQRSRKVQQQDSESVQLGLPGLE